MSLLRVQRTAQQTLTHTSKVDEVLTDYSGAATATVKRLDGTSIAGSPFTAAHPGLGTYTFVLPAQAQLDSLTVDWAGSLAGATVTLRDYVEIVGGYLFNLDAARNAHKPALDNTTTYPASLLADARTEVEQEFEWICQQAFVPRFERQVLNGTGNWRLAIPQDQPHRFIRTLRAVSIDGVALAAPDVAAIQFSQTGVLTRPVAPTSVGAAPTFTVWPTGVGNIIVEYEHGWDIPPIKVRDAGIQRLRSSVAPSGVPERAISFISAEGGTYRLSTPDERTVGIPEIDGVLKKYRRRPRLAVG